MGKIFGYSKKKDTITPEMPQNAHYEAISSRLGILQVILYLSLFAFVIISLITNSELVTYRNFYYFFKDLNASFESISVYGEESVTYSTADEQSFVIYRNGLAVAGNNSVTVFTETGRQTLSQTISYKNPVAKGAGRFLLVYELGGTHYSLYNSYTQIHTGISEYPIQTVSVSDSGMYAIVTASEEYTSVVSLYNSNFSLVNRYNKNGYVMDVDLDADGNQIAVLTSLPKDGLFYTELLLHQPGSGNQETVVPIGNALALQCAYTEAGDVGILCSNGYTVVKNGQATDFYDFRERDIVAADLSKDGLAVALRDSDASAKYELLVFDTSGAAVYRQATEETPVQLVRNQNAVFVLHSDGIVRIDMIRGTTSHYECHTEHRVLLAQNENSVVLCSPQKAVFLKIE